MSHSLMRKLTASYVEKIWGIAQLPPPFPHPASGPIGEIWFDPPPELPELLVKYIFAAERLSVQAHPDDAQARAMGLGQCGKSECWVILDAEPGATIAVGFEDTISADTLRRSALDGSIVDRLTWHEVTRGDVFYLPPGTVHAIGGGISLIEVQQNSDLTLRLYDYGRPRELHLDDALDVARRGPHPAELRARLSGDSGILVDGPRFRLVYWQCDRSPPVPLLEDRPACVVPFSGEVHRGAETLATGECAVMPPEAIGDLTGDGLLLIAQPTTTKA